MTMGLEGVCFDGRPVLTAAAWLAAVSLWGDERRWPPWSPVLNGHLHSIWPAVEHLWEGPVLLRMVLDENPKLALEDSPPGLGMRRRRRPLVPGEVVENWVQLRESCFVRWGLGPLSDAQALELDRHYAACVHAVLAAAPGSEGRGAAISDIDAALLALAREAGMHREPPSLQSHAPVVAAINTGARVSIRSPLPPQLVRLALLQAGVHSDRLDDILSWDASRGAGLDPSVVLVGRVGPLGDVLGVQEEGARGEWLMASWGWATASQQAASPCRVVHEGEVVEALGCSEDRMVMDGIAW